MKNTYIQNDWNNDVTTFQTSTFYLLVEKLFSSMIGFINPFHVSLIWSKVDGSQAKNNAVFLFFSQNNEHCYYVFL